MSNDHSHAEAQAKPSPDPLEDLDPAAEEIIRKIEEAAEKTGAAAQKAAAEAKAHMNRVMHPALTRFHGDDVDLGIRLANRVTGGMGSWRFIIIQTVLVIIWITLNVAGLVFKWDPYPFILLNLMFSVQAAYASPLILMAGNVAAARDRDLWEHDYLINQQAYAKIEAIEKRTQEMVESLNGLIKDRMPAGSK